MLCSSLKQQSTCRQVNLTHYLDSEPTKSLLLLLNATRLLRDRPFNLKGGGGGVVMVFCFVQNFFFEQHKSQNLFFFCCAKREKKFQNSTLGYMTKALNQIIFFPPPKSEYFFQQHWESEYFF